MGKVVAFGETPWKTPKAETPDKRVLVPQLA